MKALATYPDEPRPDPGRRPGMVFIPQEPSTWSSLTWDPYTVTIVEVSSTWRPDGYLGWDQ